MGYGASHIRKFCYLGSGHVDIPLHPGQQAFRWGLTTACGSEGMIEAVEPGGELAQDPGNQEQHKGIR